VAKTPLYKDKPAKQIEGEEKTRKNSPQISQHNTQVPDYNTCNTQAAKTISKQAISQITTQSQNQHSRDKHHINRESVHKPAVNLKSETDPHITSSESNRIQSTPFKENLNQET